MTSSKTADLPSLLDLYEQGGIGPSVKWNHYFEIYERYLEKFRGKPARYLEIGVFGGGSLDLMRKYLGEQAAIFGIDIDPQCARYEAHGHRIFIGDQANQGFLKQCVKEAGELDIVVDDGGHTPTQQIISFIELFPALRNGGVYIVEDLHATFWPSYQDAAIGINFYDFARGLVEKLSLWHLDERSLARFRIDPDQRQGRMNVPNFATRSIFGIHFYNSMVVFEKREVPEPWERGR